MLKGICARYKARWGDEAFIPNRKQPFSLKHMLDIVMLLTTGTSKIASWSSTLRSALLTGSRPCQCNGHATARGTHNPNMIGDMPNAHYGRGDGTGEPSPTPLAIPSARPPHALAGSLTTRHTPEPLGLTASRRTTDRVQPLAGASPPALPGAGAQQPARGAVAGMSKSTGEIDELIAELARRRSPRRTPHELGSLSTEAIDEAIETHPRRRPSSPQPATAADARRRAARDVADRLVSHDSQYAL